MLANGKLFHGDHHPVSVAEGRKSRNLWSLDQSFDAGSNRSGNFRGPIEKFGLEVGKTYTLSIECFIPSTDTSTNTRMTVSQLNGTSSIDGKRFEQTARDKFQACSLTFTIWESTDTMQFYLLDYSVPKTDRTGTLVRNIMLNEGSTALPYEPYGTVADTIFEPSESEKTGKVLEFPNSYNHFAEVSVSGKSDQVQFTGKNIFLNPNPVFYSSDNGNKNCTTKVDDYQKIIPVRDGNCYHNPGNSGKYNIGGTREQGKTYTISFDIKTPDTIGMYWYPSEHYSLRDYIKGSSDWQRVSYTYTQTGPTVHIGEKPVDSVNANGLFGFHSLIAGHEYCYKNIQLEQSSAATPYEPYVGGIPSPNPEYPQPITSVDSLTLGSSGRNLDRFEEVPNTYVDTLSGNLIHYNGWYSTGFFQVSGSVSIKAVNRTNPTGSCVFYSAFYDADKNFISGTQHVVPSGDFKEFSVPSGAKFMRTSYGSYFIDREIYAQHVTRTIDLQGNELRSLPDGTHGELRVKRDGRVQLVQRSGRVKFRIRGRSFSINTNQNRSYIGYPCADSGIVATSNTLPNVYCESLLPATQNATWKAGMISQAPVGRTYYLCLDPSVTTVDGFADLLEGKELIYPLAEPVTINLPPIDPLPTYWPTTVIYDQDGNDISAFVKVID